jgi:LysM repeat protein
MHLFTMGFRIILIFFFIPFLNFGQTVGAGDHKVDYLTVGYDIRNIDIFNLKNPTLVSGEFKKIFEAPLKNSVKLDGRINTSIEYVSSPYDFEKKVLKSDTISNFYLSNNSHVFSNRVLNSTTKPILVYSINSSTVHKESIEMSAIKLDSLFIDAVKRIFKDRTIPGFVHHFGTHYAVEVKFGGYYINRAAINNDEFIYSPYDENRFKETVSNFFESHQEGKNFSDPFLNINSTNQYHSSNKGSFKTINEWQKEINDNLVPLVVKKERLSRLLTRENFPNDTLIDRKREALDFYINFIEYKLKRDLQKPTENNFFTKFAIPFRQRLVSVLKISSGNEGDNTSSYTGDIFFGGFTDYQTSIATTGAIERGGVKLQTLITDEKIEVNKILDYIVPHAYFENGFANVWDESQKLIKGVGRTDLIVSGEPENRIYFKEALRRKVQKTISLQTIDSDVYEVVYSLEHLNVSNEIQSLKPTHNYVMESELLAASSVGDITLLEQLYNTGVNINSNRLVRVAILANQPVEFYNRLFDLGIKPTMDDLDLLFDTEYYNNSIALIFLERGAKPKNNMIFKAVAYRSPNVVKALIREGAEPANNDLNFAMRLNDLELISALTGKDVVAITDGQIVYRENNQIIEPENTIEIYVVKKGDYLGKIARAYNTTVVNLREWNNLKSNTIFVNQKLKIYINNTKETSILSNTKTKTIQNQNKIFYTVVSGDYLGKIALENNVTVNDIKKWNNLMSNRINVNQKLIVGIEDQINEDHELIVVKNEELINSLETEITISNNNQEAVSLENYLDLTTQTEQDAMDAIQQNNELLAITIIENLNIKNERILSSAVRNGQKEVVTSLLKNGTNPDLAVEMAIYYRQLDILKALVSYKASLTSNHLILAIKTDYTDAFVFFIENGLSPVETSLGETPLHQLVMSYSPNRLEMLKYLIDTNINLNIKNEKNETPLHKAVRVGPENIPIISILLDSGVDPSIKDNQGKLAFDLTADENIKDLLASFQN